jgi:putative endonuclease
MTTRATGGRYEDVALAHLQRAGLRLIARNATYRHGELDLVMRDGADIVFVEVRYRRSDRFGDGIDSIGPAKRGKLVRAAQLFLAAHPALAKQACRFDVVAIGATDGEPHWLRNAFEAF